MTSRIHDRDPYALLGGRMGPVCFGLGLVAMYFLDPSRGRTRRKRVADKLTRWSNRLQWMMRHNAVDARNRMVGVAAEMRSKFQRDDASDWTIAERVRAHIGHAIGHARGVKVSVRNGVVMLRGHVPEHELSSLISATRRVRGVQGVETYIEIDRVAAATA